jgi:hypothetical protein
MCLKIEAIKKLQKILTSHGPIGVTRVSISRDEIEGMARNSSGRMITTKTCGHNMRKKNLHMLIDSRLIAGRKMKKLTQSLGGANNKQQ